MRLLVTGGAGFIGSHVVERLLVEGHQVLVVDDLSTGAERNLAPAEPSPGLPGARAGALTVRRMDVADAALVELARDWRPEVVVHLAAQVSVRHSVADPVGDARVNVLGTVNVLTAAHSGGARKVVFTSSVAVYGSPAALPVSAGAGLEPRSPYAAAKVCGEVYLDTYRVLYGLDFTTLTLANVYGPRQNPSGEAGVVAIFGAALLRERPTRIFGDGTQTRDYVYVEDVVDAYVRACGERGGGRRFNIGSGVQTTDRQLHTIVAEAAGAPDEPAFAPPRPGDLAAMAIDPIPARDGLGWIPRTELRDGVKATVDWLRANS